MLFGQKSVCKPGAKEVLFIQEIRAPREMLSTFHGYNKKKDSRASEEFAIPHSVQDTDETILLRRDHGGILLTQRILGNCFQTTEPCSHSETTAALILGCPGIMQLMGDLDITHVVLVLQENARIKGSRRFLLRFQRDACQVKANCSRVRVLVSFS